MNELSASLLGNARLVVIAGVHSPTPTAVELLRQYVEDGGQLLITAGAAFQPAAWNSAAWNDGQGILPVALAAEWIGGLPDAETDAAISFHLDPASFRRDVFALRVSDSQWNELIRAPFFYQAVRVDSNATAAGSIDAGTTEQDSSDTSMESLPEPSNERAQVIGSYADGEPFAVVRRIGQGHVMLVTTGCYPRWNNLAVSPQGGILLYDQMLRWLVGKSIVSRTFSERRELVVPVDPRDQNTAFQLHRPEQRRPDPLSIEAVGENEFAAVIRGLGERGVYALRKTETTAGDGFDGGQYTFAVNGPDQESDLETVGQDSLDLQSTAIWIHSDQAISLTRGSSGGHDLWLWFLGLALLCLLVEMAVAAGPAWGRLVGKEAAR